MRKRLSINEYKSGILEGNKVILSKAITLIESTLESDEELATELIQEILPYSGNSIRIGITGVPGVGKSTFIESFGNYVINQNRKIAVLAIDPTSSISKGSILGDKTRMETLSVNPKAYIRPSASSNSLGGVARKTRETMFLCEAAGYNTIFIETVGVGQSETAVYDMVDFFLLLMLAGAGDELQGIKRGIMEMADALSITKADGENLTKANAAKIEYENALHLFPKKDSDWYPKTTVCSSLLNKGMDEIWNIVLEYQSHTMGNGYFTEKRKKQNLKWMHETIHHFMEVSFYQNEEIKKRIFDFENSVSNGKTDATKAAKELFSIYLNKQNA